jgi:transcriptional regulator GlxA family with amidase domain
MATITFLAYDRCMFSGITGLMDAFAIANLWIQYFQRKGEMAEAPPGPAFNTEIVTMGGEPVVTSHGVQIQPDRAMEDVDGADLILIPPYLFANHSLPDDMTEIKRWLVEQYHRRARIGAVCTGAFILAMTGLLDGKIATTNWQVARRFQRQFPKVRLKPERVLTEDSGLICSGAVTAQYNLGLYVIELYGSEDLSRACAKALLVDPNRTAQTPYVIANFSKNHGDKDILKAQQWMEDHYSDPITVDDAARHVGLSPRHFKRRFKTATHETPLAYIQQIRLESAKKRLETTTDNIDEITHQIGYEDSSTFRRLFKKYTDLSPRAYREKFSSCRSRR